MFFLKLQKSMDNVQPTNSRKREKGDAGRCTKQPSKRRHSKKRKFAGNQNTKRDGASSNIQTPVSLKKVKSIKRKKVDRIEGYRLIDIQIFEDIITSLACPECCEKTLYVEEDLTKKKGLATYISVLCECGYAKENYTSKAVINNPMSNKKGMKPFEINTRAVYALGSCGVGHTWLEKICCILNMPKPMTVMNYE